MFDERIALGLPSLAGYDLAGALTKARELGFQSFMSLPGGPRTQHSLGPFPTLGYYGATEGQRRELAEALAPVKHIAIHQAWDDQWRTWIDCAACVGAEILTVHAGRRREGQKQPEFLAERSAHLQRIGERAADSGVRIGIENEGGTCDDFLALIAATDHPAVGATLDLGHCAYFVSVLAVADDAERVAALNETIRAVVESLGERLFSLHVHDVRLSDWRDHRCVGSGVIDFSALFAELGRVGYAGLFEVELEEPDRASAATRSGEILAGLLASGSDRAGSATAVSASTPPG